VGGLMAVGVTHRHVPATQAMASPPAALPSLPAALLSALPASQRQPTHVHLGQGLVLARIQFRFSLSALFLICRAG